MINRNSFNKHTFEPCFLSGRNYSSWSHRIKILLRINTLTRDESFVVRTQGYKEGVKFIDLL